MSDSPPDSAQQPNRWEKCSTNLELDLLPSFLELIVPLIDSGFGAHEAQQVVGLARSMSVDEEKSLKFPIVVSGKKSQLVVRLFMDDIAAPDIYLTTEPSLCARISAALDEFMSGM
jgi:hypothetical protein